MTEIVMYIFIGILIVAATTLRIAGRLAVRKALEEEQKKENPPQ